MLAGAWPAGSGDSTADVTWAWPAAGPVLAWAWPTGSGDLSNTVSEVRTKLQCGLGIPKLAEPIARTLAFIPWTRRVCGLACGEDNGLGPLTGEGGAEHSLDDVPGSGSLPLALAIDKVVPL